MFVVLLKLALLVAAISEQDQLEQYVIASLSGDRKQLDWRSLRTRTNLQSMHNTFLSFLNRQHGVLWYDVVSKCVDEPIAVVDDKQASSQQRIIELGDRRRAFAVRIPLDPSPPPPLPAIFQPPHNSDDDDNESAGGGNDDYDEYHNKNNNDNNNHRRHNDEEFSPLDDYSELELFRVARGLDFVDSEYSDYAPFGYAQTSEPCLLRDDAAFATFLSEKTCTSDNTTTVTDTRFLFSFRTHTLVYIARS